MKISTQQWNRWQGKPCEFITLRTLAALSDHKSSTDVFFFFFIWTYQLTNIAALFSAMNGSSPQTLQKPNSKIHHNRIFTPCRFPSTFQAQQAVRSERGSPSRARTEQGCRLVVLGATQVPFSLRTWCLLPHRTDHPNFSSSPSQPPSASVICAPACNHRWSRFCFSVRSSGKQRMYVPQSRVARPDRTGTDCLLRTHTHTLKERERAREPERQWEREIQDADCDKGLVRQKNPILPGESSSHLWIFYSLSDSMARQDFWEKK